MDDTSGAASTPWVLDTSVLTAIARGDTRVMTLVQALDAAGRPLVIPALAVTAAALDIRTEEAIDLLRGLELIDNATTAPLHDTRQAIRVAEVIAVTELDPWEAHVAAVADASICPILTLNGDKWREHSNDLDDPLHCIEISDPEGT
jgi:hypothetical protein